MILTLKNTYNNNDTTRTHRRYEYASMQKKKWKKRAMEGFTLL